MKAYNFILKRLRKDKNFAEVIPECDDKPCCPYCGKVLSAGEPKRLQSLEEHVYDPNGIPSYKTVLQCNNDDCFLGKFSIWSEDGSSYSSDMYVTMLRDDNMSKDVDKICKMQQRYMPSAINTFQRRMDVENSCYSPYKRAIYLSPLLMFNKRQPYIEIIKIANNQGKVLKLKFCLQFLRKDECGNFCLLCTRFDKDIKFEINRIKFKKDKKNFDKKAYLEKFQKRARITVADKMVMLFVKYFVKSDK